MAGPVFRIAVELGHLIPPGSPITADIFPHLSRTVQRVAEEAHARWLAYANGAPLPSGLVISNRTGEYARSIQLHQIGPFSAEVYTDLRYAHLIEEGTQARDMKRMLGSSLKVRINAKGKRYLIIPFRWNTPNSVLGHAMPEAVHNWWQQPGRNPTHIVGTYLRPSGTGAYDIKTRQLLTVPGWRYGSANDPKRWGDRLGKGELEGMGIKGQQASRMAGMVQFRKLGGSGGSSHSQFLTFRVMTEDSRGWQQKAQPGKFPAKTVADQMQPIADAAFKRAVEEDVKQLMGFRPGQ